MTDSYPTAGTRSRVAMRLLAPEDAERVYAAALDRLARDGVVPACVEARKALLAAGATGAVEGVVRLAADLAEEAAARAPKRVVLGARAADGDVVVEPGRSLLVAGGSPAPRVQPLAGGAPRPATLSDLAEACRLADALPDVAVVAGPPLSTAAGRDERSSLTEIGCALRGMTKHLLLTGVTSVTTAAAAADMAGALRDDEVGLRRRPPLSLLGGAETFEAAVVFARRGLPVGTLVAPLGGAGSRVAPSPAGLAETLVAFVADVLATNAALQARAPGVAYLGPAWPALAGLPASGPDAATFIVAATQVVARAGLPGVAGAFGTSAPAPDWEACTDGSFAALCSVLAGATLVSGAGTLHGAGVFSPQQLVADAEIFSWCASVAAGIEVDDETLAVDAIKQVGIGGNFLGQGHTRRHMKDVWRPRLLDRTSWDAWVTGGRQSAAEKATALAGELLAGHEVEPLDTELTATLERIIATAGL